MENAGDDQAVTPTRGSPSGLTGSQLAGDLPFDADKYKAHMEGSDLTDERQVEFLQTLWSIMKAFVDLGFGVDSIQRLFPEILAIPSETETDRIESKAGKHIQEFEEAAFDPAAEGGDS